MPALISLSSSWSQHPSPISAADLLYVGVSTLVALLALTGVEVRVYVVAPTPCTCGHPRLSPGIRSRRQGDRLPAASIARLVDDRAPVGIYK